jgi:integrase
MPNYKGRRPGTRRIVISVKGKPLEWIVEGSKTDGDNFEARKRIELGESELSTRVAPKFSAYCAEKYAPYAEANLKRSTWHQSRIYHVASLTLFFGAKKLTEFTAEDVERYKAHRRKHGGIRNPTMNAELRCLRTILGHAQKMGYPVKIPPIVFLSEPDGRVKVWTSEELDRLFVAARARSPVMLRLILFLVNTGCRKGEALAAEWSWMDFARSMIRIPANEAWHPKNGRAREVPMSDSCRVVLEAPRRSDRWVFPNDWGRRHKRFPDPLFEEIQKAAGLSGGPHTLRHSFASHFLQAVPDLYLLSQVLGHSHERVTELYAHLLPGHLLRARNAVNLTAPAEVVATSMATETEPAKIA